MADDADRPTLARFGVEYAKHRAHEGRGLPLGELLRLPNVRTGPFSRQWSARACSFHAFVKHVLHPHARRLSRSLKLLDLGAGNGWLSYRVALEGHQAMALDIRLDAVDGLGAAAPFVARTPDRLDRVVASFEAIPFRSSLFDIAVFNASIHYATDLSACLREAARVVRPGGVLAILDSPFYHREQDGVAMVAEKNEQAAERFGDLADTLMGLPFIEFLTREQLASAWTGLGLDWRRRRVFYPLWYELRPIQAAIQGKRRPSRFDLWYTMRR